MNDETIVTSASDGFLVSRRSTDFVSLVAYWPAGGLSVGQITRRFRLKPVEAERIGRALIKAAGKEP